MSRILRFFVCLGTLFFAGNALAAGYTCSSLPKYVSCQAGYYMTSSSSSTTYNGTPKTGNYCQPCTRMGSNYTCAGGTAAPQQSAGGYSCPTYKKYTSCSAGYYMTNSSTSSTYNGTPKAGNACRPCSVYGSNYTCAGGTAAPQAITVNVTCQAGQYLPKGATSCTTCPAGSYCPGGTFSSISLVTGATSNRGITTCPGTYSNSATGSSTINDCYLILNDGEMVGLVNMGSQLCNEGYYCNHDGQKIYYDEDEEERDLTDSRPTVGGYEACARGSYTADYEATSCDACPNGKTTSGTGSTSCDVTCSNSANVATWNTATWQENYVSNHCSIKTCATGYKLENNKCVLSAVTCAAGQYLPKGATSCATCPAGYKCPSSGTYTVSTTTDQGNTACSGSTEYQDATGQTSCKTPSDGYYKKDNTSQQVCGTGYFCKSGTRTACTTYGTGYTTDTTTASVNTQCYLNVAAGKVRKGTTGTTLNTCTAGTYKAAHKAYYGTSYSCDSCTGRTKYSAAGAASCSTVSSGYYTTGCNSSNNNCTGQSQCTSGTWCASGVQNQCSSLTGVSVSGGTYSSAVGSSANTACKYTAPSKTITGCATVTTNTVTYSGTAWPATTYGVTANGGYIISGNNTAAATCSQCGTAKYSAGGTATSCSSCPTADSGWTVTSPAGSTAYTACYEYQTPVNCASGSVKRAASSATAYSSTISLLSTLKSDPGYYASTTATSCTICPAGSSCAASATAPTTCANWTYAASTGQASCTACPALTSGWAKADSTGTGWKSHTSCVQTSPTPTNCAGGNLKQVAASNGATTWGASAVNSALSSKAGYYVNGTACSACTGATYYGGGTATSCTACPSIYTSNTTAAKSKVEQCEVKTTGGYYIKTAKDDTQTRCDANYYCPSATVAYGSTNSQNACPTAADHKRATIPADYYASSIANTYLSTSAGRADITGCQVLNTYNGTRGSLYDYLTYNTTTQKYDVQGTVLWFKANPGYYLTKATGCGTYAYYGKAVECDKNAYCPGKNAVACNSSNQATVQVEKFGLELCSALGNGKYATSDGGAAANSTAACYLTTTAPNFVAAAGAAESACTAGGWCPGNVKVAYGSTGGRNACPTAYPSSAASSNSNLDCYVTTAAGKYVATVGAGQVNCAGTGYYCPGGTNVYSGTYGSRLTTGGRTQCPAGYRDLVATVSTTKEAQCTMNVDGGKFVKVAKESAASGTCDAGYAKAAHTVTYGNTSACAACTGATYAASTGQAACTACPTAKTYASAVQSYGYWNSGKEGDHTISDGCYATMSGTLSNGSLTWHGCYLGTDGDYGNGGGKRCYVHQNNFKCNAGYYASTLSSGYVWNNTRAGLLSDTCVGVGAGYYSSADVLTRSQCPTGLTTIGYGAGADEVTDCGRILHFGDDKLYLRSGKKTTPSLNVKIGDTTYYGNMTAGTGKGKLRLKSGTTTYSVHDDSM